MPNWRKYRSAQARKERSARARHAAQVRWERWHADIPQRGRRVVEITVKDSHRPMTAIIAEQFEDDQGRWGRWRVAGHEGRPRGANGMAKLLTGVFA